MMFEDAARRLTSTLAPRRRHFDLRRSHFRQLRHTDAVKITRLEMRAMWHAAALRYEGSFNEHYSPAAHLAQLVNGLFPTRALAQADHTAATAGGAAIGH